MLTTASVVLDFLLVLLLTFIVFITIVGNLLVCLAVVLVRKLRKPQNYLLVSLAVSDLFVALFVMPFAIVYEVYKGVWPLSNGLCDVWVSGDVLLCSSSILNLCAISLDRYRAITRPLEYSSASNPRRMLFVIFIVWISSACVSLPPVLLLGNEYVTPNGTPTCTLSQNYWYQLYATMVSFYLPLCVMVTVYCKILHVVTVKKKQMSWTNCSSGVGGILNPSSNSLDRNTLTKTLQLDTTILPPLNSSSTPNPSNQTESPTQPQSQIQQYKLKKINQSQPHPISSSLSPSEKKIKKTKHQILRTNQGSNISLAQSTYKVFFRNKTQDFRPRVRLKEHKASTTLGIIMSAFIICWLPFFVLALIRPIFLQSYEVPEWVSSLFLWLGYANSALNPVIYATLNRDFRRPFQEILCCRCSTLDDLMRREFYDTQYGRDEQCERSKRKVKEAQSLDQETVNHSSDVVNGMEVTDPVAWTSI